MKTVNVLFVLLGTVGALRWGFSAGKLDIDGTPYNFALGDARVTASLAPTAKLKVQLNTKLDDEPKRPHQCMLIFRTTGSNDATEAAVMMSVKPSTGRATATLSQKDFGALFMVDGRVEISVVIGGPGDDEPINQQIAVVEFLPDPKKPIVGPARARYGPQPDINHIFRQAQKSPAFPVSLFFSMAILLGLVGLIGIWMQLKANISSLGTAVEAAILPHIGLMFALLGIEGLLVVFWLQLRIYEAIFGLSTFGALAFLTGRPALREMQLRQG
ncbi:hypothetical protein PYCC9005_001923 [Savitreella phatthalungensis]